MAMRFDKQREQDRLDLLLRETMQPEKLQEQEMLITNNLLKMKLKQKQQVREIPLWYLPGMLHAVILFLMAAAVCVLIQMHFIQLTAIVLAAAGSLTGVVITRLGVRFFGLKERLTLRLNK